MGRDPSAGTSQRALLPAVWAMELYLLCKVLFLGWRPSWWIQNVCRKGGAGQQIDRRGSPSPSPNSRPWHGMADGLVVRWSAQCSLSVYPLCTTHKVLGKEM